MGLRGCVRPLYEVWLGLRGIQAESKIEAPCCGCASPCLKRDFTKLIKQLNTDMSVTGQQTANADAQGEASTSGCGIAYRQV